MLIECKYCGAPLDVKPAQSQAKCRYCGSSSLIRETRTVAPATPAHWKPPPQWTPPAHVAADSSKPLVYRAGYWIHQLVGLLVLLGVAGVMATVAVIGLLSDLGSEPDEEARPASGKVGGVTPVPRSEPGASSGLFAAAALERLQSRYEKKLGAPVRAAELTIHATHASLTAQAPDNPDHLNRYGYRGGSVEAGKPVPNSRYRGPLARHLFDLGRIPFERIPTLIEQAKARLGYEQGKPSHLIITRASGAAERVTLRVYVRSERDSGYVEFSEQGKVLRIAK